MIAMNHHEAHPDPEMLSAFAELALNTEERGDVLKHLAVCGRCREIVARARQAASAEASAARHGVLRPRAWWRSWGLVLAPAAAAAAVAWFAIYVHERSLEKSAELAKLERQQAIEKAPMQPQTPPSSPAPATTSTLRHSAPEETKKTEPPDSAERRVPLPEPQEMAAAPPPEIMNGLLPSHAGPAQPAESDRHGSADAAPPPTAATPEGNTPSEAAVYDEEHAQQSREQAGQRRQLAATAPLPSDKHSAGSSNAETDTAGKPEPVDLSARRPETQPAPGAGDLQLHGMLSMVDRTAGLFAFHLPSGRPAVSIASADHRTLAIDNAGTLFVREDSEGTWHKVNRQWTGRAIALRRQAPQNGAASASPAPAVPNSGSLSQPETVFALVNDQSHVWVSVDGKIWTAQ